MKTSKQFFEECEIEVKDKLAKEFTYFDMLNFANLFLFEYINNKLDENDK